MLWHHIALAAAGLGSRQSASNNRRSWWSAQTTTPRPEHLEPCSLALTAPDWSTREQHSSLWAEMSETSFLPRLGVSARPGHCSRVRGRRTL